MEMFGVLQDIALRDGDIEEILFYKNINGSRFVYQRKSRMFHIVEDELEYPFFDIMADWESGRIITGTIQTGSNNAVKNKNVYGLGGILGLDEDTSIKGKFLVAFNTEAINSVFQSYSGKHGRFILSSLNGDVIFDSEGDYSGGKLEYTDMLLSGENHAVIDGQKYYIQTIEGKKFNYIGANIVHEKTLGDKNIPILIFGSITLIAIICIVLYITGGYFISRRVKEIGLAMKRVGSNNLSYRIPISKQSDELGEIAVKFNEMCDELQKTIDLEYINAIKKRNAQMESLQAGINPHFLYNTLEVIRVRAVDAGNDDVAKMIVNLANLYRSMVKNCMFIPIRNEINICELYIDTFSFHYENTLDYEINIDPQIMKYGIPKNLLHPIIENYFVHGIKNKGSNNRFVISGYPEKENINFVFEDNGRGIGRRQLEEIISSIEAPNPEAEFGYGLINVQKRIRLIYGAQYGIEIESEENSMTRITVRIKAMKCDELEASFKAPKTRPTS
ncbi:MAG: histidine kinase, partial [Clostridia bacterium]|jgi:two-component system sensor histidine kinase YesM|nr:histidine kinase [Clostridia bacterium]